MRISREAQITRTPASIPEGDSPYTCRIRASSPTADGHRTKMDLETTLKNMVVDGSDGRIACWGHNKSVPYGSTSNASIDSDGNVDMDFTIERGLTIVHADAPYGKSEDLIKMIQNEHIKKSSVNIVDGWYRCNVCKVDMFKKSGGKYPCLHWPGDEEIIEKEGKKTVVEIVPDIVDGHLGELSVVWSGSNPDAEVLERSEYMLEDHKMTRKQLFNVNRYFGTDLDAQRALPDTPERGDESVPFDKDELEQISKSVADSVGAAVREAMKPEAPAGDKSSGEDSDVKKELEKMREEIQELRQSSVDSEKQEVVSEVRGIYVEMRGKELTSESLRAYEEKLAKLTIAEVKDERDIMKGYMDKIKEEVEGERKSNDGDEAEKERSSFDEAGSPEFVKPIEGEPNKKPEIV